MRFNTELYNVILTGVAFLLLFTAFQTVSQSSQNVLEAAATETMEVVGQGYVSLSILYAAFSICNWFAAVVVMMLGMKYAMFAGSVCYVAFVATFLEPRAWSIYLGSVVSGCGAAVLWTAQGSFITACSDETNANQYFSIFWGLFQSSQVVGGLYTYFSLSNVSIIDRALRHHLILGSLACASLGCLLFLGLRSPHSTTTSPDHEDDNCSSRSDNVRLIANHSNRLGYSDTASKAFLRSFTLLRSQTMLCILVASGFTGVSTTFWSSLFASCIGHTLAFGTDAKSFIGLVVVFVGIGEILGSLLLNLRRCISPSGLVTLFGYASALTAAFICLIMLPADSPMEDTLGNTYITPNIGAAIVAAALFGMVDAVWNTQLGVLIGSTYREHKEDIPVAFALYRCIQSVLTAISFSYASKLLLHWQVLIYVLLATLGVACFFRADSRPNRCDSARVLGVNTHTASLRLD